MFFKMRINMLIVLFVMLTMAMVLHGCAWVDGNYSLNTQKAYYTAQTQIAQAQITQAQKKTPSKTFSLELTDDGRVKSFAVDLEPILNPQRPISLADIKPPAPHPVIQGLKTALYSPVASTIAYVWGAVRMTKTISNGAGHNTTTTGSYNNGSYNDSGGGPMGITTGSGTASIARDTITTTSSDSHNIADSYNDSSDNSTSSVADSNNTDNSQHDSGWTDDNSDNSRWTDDHSDNRQDFNNQQDDNRQDFNKPDNRYNYNNPQTTP